MGAFYGSKIKDGEINPKTEKIWMIGDVPSYWKEKVEDWLKRNKNK